MPEAATVRYAGASAMTASGLALVASNPVPDAGAAAEQTPFYVGRVHDAQTVARMLFVLGQVVDSRHHVPPQMVARLVAEADPVVTLGDGVLRFEGFSRCCSAYARVDLLPDAHLGEEARHGTTNVDFSGPLRAALGSVRARGDLGLRVSEEALAVRAGGSEIEQRRIALPDRWVRGFLHLGRHAARLTPRGEMAWPEAVRLWMQLPRDDRTPAWIARVGGGWRLVRRPVAEGIRASGTSRLRALQGLLQGASRVVWFGDPEGQTSGVVVEQGPVRFTLMTTADPWRGFSGEGDGLEHVGTGPGIAALRARLRWQPLLRAEDLGSDTAAMARLAAQGLLGFDLAEQAWFHREFPWRPERTHTLYPRIRRAERLVAEEGVRFGSDSVAYVRGTHAEHTVDLSARPVTCTCRWFAKTQGRRGPCKHVLAAQRAVASR